MRGLLAKNTRKSWVSVRTLCDFARVLTCPCAWAPAGLLLAATGCFPLPGLPFLLELTRPPTQQASVTQRWDSHTNDRWDPGGTCPSSLPVGLGKSEECATRAPSVSPADNWLGSSPFPALFLSTSDFPEALLVSPKPSDQLFALEPSTQLASGGTQTNKL